MAFTSNIKDDPEISKYYIGFNKGLNTVQDPSLVDDRNLTYALNVSLAVDGIQRRPGTTKAFDEGGGNQVYGATGFYKKTTNERWFLRIANGRLQYLDSSAWTSITTHTFTNARTIFVQARDKVFIYNGTDALRYYNGTAISTYTALTVPVGLAVAATGGTGSAAYSYEITAFNANGETTACTAVSISNGVATLSATTYNALTWTATANAVGYNIYGRRATGWGRVYLSTVYTNAYNDTGADTETTSKLAPDSNNTGGIIAKGGIYTMGRQFLFGITEGSTYHPCRLYYSGTVQYIDSFSGGTFGGGWTDIYANDGGEIVDIKPYSNGVLVWKTNGLFKFYFTSAGLPAVSEITRGHGGCSFWASQSADNDYMYVAKKENRIAVMTVGQQENYMGDQLRTNEISIFISDRLLDVNMAQVNKIASWYYQDNFGFTYPSGTSTTNDGGYVIDTRFGGWVEWDGLPMLANSYVVYDNGTEVNLYGCSQSDGYMIQMYQTNANDNNAAFTSVIGTKFWNFGMFDVEKIVRNPVLWFKYISSGSLSVKVWMDGQPMEGSATLGSGLSSQGSGIGADLPGLLVPGWTSSYALSDLSGADIPQEIQMIEMGRSIGFYLTDTAINTQWLFMGVHLTGTPLYGKPLGELYRVQVA